MNLYGFHLLRGDRLYHFSSLNRYHVRHLHKVARRDGWKGRRWRVTLVERNGALFYG